MAFNFPGQFVGSCSHPQFTGLHSLYCKFIIISGLFGGGEAFDAGALIKEAGFSAA